MAKWTQASVRKITRGGYHNKVRQIQSLRSGNKIRKWVEEDGLPSAWFLFLFFARWSIKNNLHFSDFAILVIRCAPSSLENTAGSAAQPRDHSALKAPPGILPGILTGASAAGAISLAVAALIFFRHEKGVPSWVSWSFFLWLIVLESDGHSFATIQ